MSEQQPTPEKMAYVGDVSIEDLFGKQEPLDPELTLYMAQGPMGMPCIKHPLVFSMMHHDAMNAMANKKLAILKAEVAKAAAAGKWRTYVWHHERPYRLNALMHATAHGLEGPEYWHLLGEVWTDAEYPRQHGNSKWLYLFGRMTPGKEELMDEEERDAFAALPERVTVYRGHQSDNASGLSWTLSLDKAKWFARRLLQPRQVGMVTQGELLKADAYAFFTGRNEEELVTNPRFVKSRKIIDRYTKPVTKGK